MMFEESRATKKKVTKKSPTKKSVQKRTGEEEPVRMLDDSLQDQSQTSKIIDPKTLRTSENRYSKIVQQKFA